MNAPDIIRITKDQNPAVFEALSKLKVGEQCELEAHLTLKASDVEGMDFTVEAWVPEGYEIDDEDEHPDNMAGEPDGMTATARMVRRTDKAPPVPPSPPASPMMGQ